MDVIWDPEKAKKLLLERGIHMEEVAEIIIDGSYVDLLENPIRANQVYFIIELKRYMHVVPCLINKHEQIVIKTVYPSRKYNKKYKR